MFGRRRSLRAVLVASVLSFSASKAFGQITVYVSPTGNDLNAGTSDSPLATLEGARNHLRTLGRSQPVTVEFADGMYKFDHVILFGSEDSGTASNPIVYRAAPGAVVRFSGGTEITGWTPVTDPAILTRLLPKSRRRVLVADLLAQGFSLSSLGKVSTRGIGGAGIFNPVPEPELFWEDAALVLARWPNEGWKKSKKKKKERNLNKDGFRRVVGKIDDQNIVVDTARMSRWLNESDPWIFAYWYHNWADLGEPVAGFDASANVIVRTGLKPVYGVDPSKARWYVYNMLSEIDRRGEYYIDRVNGLAYMWPLANPGNPVLSQVRRLVVGTGLSYVTFQGFMIEAFRQEAFDLSGGTAVHIVGCTIRNIGRRGIYIHDATNCSVYGCDIYNIGSHAIDMRGGDRNTLSAGGNNAENNHIHHWSRRNRAYTRAVKVRGVGNRVANNLMHHAPHMALSAAGNEHVFEFNEVHNVLQETGDAGAYYSGRDWTGRGTEIRYNYFHDMVGGAGRGAAIYFDDQWVGTTVRGNIFERCPRAIFVGGGDDNIVVNNVFKNCWRSVRLDDRGMTWQAAATKDREGTLQTRLRSVPYKSEPWASAYPELVNVLEDDPGMPKRNVFRSNVSAGGRFDDLAVPSHILALQTVQDNLAFDEDSDWVTIAKDPIEKLSGVLFRDEAATDAIGFSSVPVSHIGLYDDPRRASWPVVRDIDFVNLNRLLDYSIIADAGPDQEVEDNDDNGFEVVTLDGSKSTVEYGHIINYEWLEDGVEIERGVIRSIKFSPGVHSITLRVTDAEGSTATDSIVISVWPLRPEVAAFFPPNEGSGVNRNTHLVVKFNQPVRKGNGTIVIRETGGAVHTSTPVGSTNVTVEGAQVAIDPGAQFALDTGYYVTIDAGAFKDLEGDDFAGISDTKEWSFTTGGPITHSISANGPLAVDLTLEGTQDWVLLDFEDGPNAFVPFNSKIGGSGITLGAGFNTNLAPDAKVGPYPRDATVTSNVTTNGDPTPLYSYKDGIDPSAETNARHQIFYRTGSLPPQRIFTITFDAIHPNVEHRGTVYLGRNNVDWASITATWPNDDPVAIVPTGDSADLNEVYTLVYTPDSLDDYVTVTFILEDTPNKIDIADDSQVPEESQRNRRWIYIAFTAATLDVET